MHLVMRIQKKLIDLICLIPVSYTHLDVYKRQIKNNVFGTNNVIHSCIEHRVKRFIMISTDKSVNPTNVMGATKRMTEMIL